MIRSSSHSLMSANKQKLILLDKLFSDYRDQLQYYINLILIKQLPLKNLLSSKLLPNYKFSQSHYKQICYKQASEIIRSNVDYTKNKVKKKYNKVYKYFLKRGTQIDFINKRFSELNINYLGRVYIEVKNISITLDARRFSTKLVNGEFNEFIKIGLPYYKNTYLTQTINVPIKHHKQSNKFKDWTRLNSIQLRKENSEYFVVFFYEKADRTKKNTGSNLGLDIGYKKLISTSDNKFLGTDIQSICNGIANKVKGSKNHKKAIEYKKNYINMVCNQLNLNNVQSLFVEDLKNVKHKSKFSRRF